MKAGKEVASDTFQDPCPVTSTSNPLPTTVRPILSAHSLDNRVLGCSHPSLYGEQAAFGYPQPASGPVATQGATENH